MYNMSFNKKLVDICFLTGSVALGMTVGWFIPFIGGPVLTFILGVVTGVIYLRLTT